MFDKTFFHSKAVSKITEGSPSKKVTKDLPISK